MTASHVPVAPRARDTELMRAVRGLAPCLWRSFSFTCVAGFLGLAPSVYMLQVYERVVNSRNAYTLVMLTVAVLLAFVVMQVLEWAHDAHMRAAGMQLDQQLAARVLQAGMQDEREGAPGAAVQALADLRSLREFLASPVLKAAMEAPVAGLFLLLIFAIHPLLGWAALAGVVIQLVVMGLNQRATDGHLRHAQVGAQGAQRFADWNLRHAQAIAAMGMLPAIRSRWAQRQGAFLRAQTEASHRAAGFGAFARFVQLVLGSLLLGLAAWLLLHDQLQGGAAMLIVASILGTQVLRPLAAGFAQWRMTGQALQAWQRLAELLERVPALGPQMPLPAPRGRLSVENLCVTPPGSAQASLRNVSFELQPGELLVVIGPSGAGKTCLARALMGLWPSSGGPVRLDGADAYTRDKSELGPHVGYLPQEVELLEGSVAENIARFGAVDAQALDCVIREVGLQELVDSLPQGLDTDIGAEGSRLSGGQRQRIGLARALYGNPALVVLDEPNASLDEAGEAALARAIEQRRQRGTTFVVITHRVALASQADKVLCLNEGTSRALGAPSQVLAALRQKPAQAPGPQAAPGAPGAAGAQAVAAMGAAS